MLSDEDRAVFDLTLDTLADTFRILQLDQKAKNEYFKALKRMSPNEFFSAADKLREGYRKKTRDDFPLPADFFDYLSRSAGDYKEPVKFWKCRCCEVEFPAGEFKNLKCACDLEYCFRCSGCGKHCACPEGMQVYGDSAVAKEIEEILVQAPSWRVVFGKDRKGGLRNLPLNPPSNTESDLPT